MKKCLTKNSQPMEVRIRSLIQLILLSIKSAVIFVIKISSIIGKGQLTDQLAFFRRKNNLAGLMAKCLFFIPDFWNIYTLF
jgi:hypothetical protein